MCLYGRLSCAAVRLLTHRHEELFQRMSDARTECTVAVAIFSGKSKTVVLLSYIHAVARCGRIAVAERCRRHDALAWYNSIVVVVVVCDECCAAVCDCAMCGSSYVLCKCARATVFKFVYTCMHTWARERCDREKTLNASALPYAAYVAMLRSVSPLGDPLTIVAF